MHSGVLRGLVPAIGLALAAGACGAPVVVPTPTAGAPAPSAGAATPSGSAPTATTPSSANPIGSLEPSAPPTQPPGPPTTQQLIDAALAAGTIDESTALLYDVWATFGDPQLPVQYRGAEPAVDDAQWIGALAADHSAIPDAIWTQIEPYVVRPDDPASAFYPTPTAAAARFVAAAQADAQSGFVDCDSTHPLASILGTAAFRVVSPCTGSYQADLATVAATIDHYWGLETDLMGQPKPDDGTGGSNRIDFYLVDSRSECPVERSCPNLPSEFDGLAYGAPPMVGRTSSSFVIFPRNIIANTLLLKTAVVHEFWHVLEDAHNSKLYKGQTTYWLVEASAAWSEAHFVPEGANDQVYMPWFSHDFQGNDEPLNQPNGESDNRAYRSFIWPYFMQQESGGGPAIVGQAWTQLEGADSYASADATLNRLFSFDEHFADFAFRNINERLLPNNAIQPLYSGLDANFPVAGLVEGSAGVPPYGARTEADEYVTVSPPGQTVDYEETLKPLTSRYRNFTLANETEAVTIDLSQLDGGDVVATALVFRHTDSGDEWQRRDLAPGVTTWCLSDPDNHIEQFKLILSNASYQDGDNAQGSYSVTGRDSCARVHGTIVWTDHVTQTNGFGTGTGTTTVWMDVLLKGNGPDSYWDDGSSYSVHGSWTHPDIPAQSIYDCAAVNLFAAIAGSGTFVLDGSGGGHIGLITNYPSAGIAQLMADVGATETEHKEYVGPADCARVEDGPGAVGADMPTIVWCKSLAGEVTASGTIGGDGHSIDMTCSDMSQHDGGPGVTTVHEVTVTGTLFIEPTDQPSP